MAEELAGLQQQVQHVNEAESMINELHENGLLKKNAEGGLVGVNSWEEHQQVLHEREEEKQNSQRLAQQNAQIQQRLPNQERRRAGNQLVAIDEYNQQR